MKKLIKPLFCSALCVMSISVPLTALAASPEEALDLLAEQIERSSDKSQEDNVYQLTFLSGDFGLQGAARVTGKPIDRLILFVSNPHGKIVKDAQVVNTIISPDGVQKMTRARPYRGGYAVAINHLPAGRYRLETEVVIDGQLLTDEFYFNKA